MITSQNNSSLAVECDVYVVTNRGVLSRWLVDKVAVPVEIVERGRITPDELNRACGEFRLPVGRVIPVGHLETAPGDAGAGRFRCQKDAVLFALSQLETLHVFAQQLDSTQNPFGDYRKVAYREFGTDFAFRDAPTRIRISVVNEGGDPASDIETATRLRRDLWVHSGVEIDPDDPISATKRTTDTHEIFFEFVTDLPSEVDRVVNEYGYANIVRVEKSPEASAAAQ